MEYILTNHAIEQYIKRLKKMGIATEPKDPKKSIMKLLLKAQPEQVKGAHRVKRLIKHEFKPADYLVFDGWRFVVTEEKIVITVERVNPIQN